MRLCLIGKSQHNDPGIILRRISSDIGKIGVQLDNRSCRQRYDLLSRELGSVGYGSLNGLVR